jgi:hypothetical protein
MDEVTNPPATSLMTCIECRRPWLDDAERWRLLLAAGEIGLYCAECAAFEFDAP